MTDLPVLPAAPPGMCAICGIEWDEHLLRVFRAHWAEMHPARAEHYEELAEPRDGGPLGAFHDYLEVVAGGVEMPPAARLTGAPRGMPVLRFTFASSASEADGGAPPLVANLVLGEESLRHLRLIVGNAIDSAIKIGRKLR